MQSLGHSPVVAPLLEIRRLPQTSPDLTGVAALAFTSANGVEAFVDLCGERDLPVFTVGDATADVARAAGFRSVDSAGGALADLGRLVGGALTRGQIVLVPGAREPAGDLADFAPGLGFRPLPVYASVETGAAPPEGALDAVLIHSPRAGRALARLWPSLAAPPAVAAVSAAAAAPLRALQRCWIARAPTEASLLEALGRALGNPAPAV